MVPPIVTSALYGSEWSASRPGHFNSYYIQFHGVVSFGRINLEKLHYVDITASNMLQFQEDNKTMGSILLATASRPVLGPTQSPTQLVPEAISSGVKRPGRTADHSPPSSVEGKNSRTYTSSPQYMFTAWCLVKHRDCFTFYLRFGFLI
jgi:hypothetical protein